MQTIPEMLDARRREAVQRARRAAWNLSPVVAVAVVLGGFLAAHVITKGIALLAWTMVNLDHMVIR